MGDRMTWDHHADHDLLAALIQELQPNQEALRAVRERMLSFGYSCTVKAITQHLQKLRRKEGQGQAAKDNNDSSDQQAATPKTPAGRKRAAGAGGKKTPGTGGTGTATKRKSGINSDYVNALIDDDEEYIGTPSKRTKKEQADPGNIKREPGVKTEDGVLVKAEESSGSV